MPPRHIRHRYSIHCRGRSLDQHDHSPLPGSQNFSLFLHTIRLRHSLVRRNYFPFRYNQSVGLPHHPPHLNHLNHLNQRHAAGDSCSRLVFRHHQTLIVQRPVAPHPQNQIRRHCVVGNCCIALIDLHLHLLIRLIRCLLLIISIQTLRFANNLVIRRDVLPKETISSPSLSSSDSRSSSDSEHSL